MPRVFCMEVRIAIEDRLEANRLSCVVFEFDSIAVNQRLDSPVQTCCEFALIGVLKCPMYAFSVRLHAWDVIIPHYESGIKFET